MKVNRKFWQYEYWPSWVFYSPFIPYWMWKTVLCGDATYFCRVNPGIEFGGVLDYSKFHILKQIPAEFKPKTEYVFTKSDQAKLPKFPFVAKPDVGERGINVEIIRNQSDWGNYPVSKDIILQEFIELPLEFGIFYVHNPKTNQAEILSITGKEFLIFESNGDQTLKEFIESHPRASSRLDYLKAKFSEDWEKIHPKGKQILLEPIGNHNRGTKFYNASHLITPSLVTKTHWIAQQIEGFHYGRFDVKASSEEALKKGEFIILEINGSNSEPTHIYDPEFNLFRAYQEAKRHFDWQYQIALTLPKNQDSMEFFRAVWIRIFP